MLAVFGTVALDTIRTPRRTHVRALGGSASYAAVSAGHFTRTGLIAVTGEDFPRRYLAALRRHTDTAGLAMASGKTFHYDARYDRRLRERKTLRLDLNVIKDHSVSVPEEYRKCRFAYLANNDPEQNLDVLRSFERVRFSMCDTIDFWIRTKYRAVVRAIGETDATVMNQSEAELLTGEFDVVRAARRIAAWGATYVIIKKDEHGAILYHRGTAYPFPAFPVEGMVDPTGAGDAFAGAVMGYLESRNSTSLREVRRAIFYGNVMGSFAVQRHGIDSLTRLKRREIGARAREYERITRH